MSFGMEGSDPQFSEPEKKLLEIEIMRMRPKSYHKD